jgi:hypothetical protein
MTIPKFDIFLGFFGNQDAVWLECVEGLAAAKQRMDEIARERPGQYFVFYPPNRAVLASTDTTKSASDSPKSLKAS